MKLGHRMGHTVENCTRAAPPALRFRACLWAVVLTVSSLSVQVAHAAQTQPSTFMRELRQVDQLLDRTLRDVRTGRAAINAERPRIADRAIGEALGLLVEAEQRIETALVTVRGVDVSAPSQAEIALVERLARGIQSQVDDANSLLDQAALQGPGYEKGRAILKSAAQNVRQTLQVLRLLMLGL